MNEWRPFFLYSVHTSYNKVLLCFTTRDHACHFLSAVKLDITRLPTLLIVFDMRAWCRLILEVSLLPSGPLWYSFWSSSRRLDTWTIEELAGWFPQLANETIHSKFAHWLVQIKWMELTRFSFMNVQKWEWTRSHN